MVAAPTGYHYDPAEQSQVSTLTEGVASDVAFTVTEDVVPTDDVTISFYDVINEVTVSATDVQSINETTTFNKDNINLPESYELYPDTQSKTVTVTNGVASPKSITFNVIKKDATGRVILNTAAGLDNVRDHMTWDFVMENDITLSGNWTPIGITNGLEDIPFTGSLDGAGYAVNGLTVSLSSDYAGGGLFCYNKGTIKDLTINDASVRIGGVAGILASQNTGTIENCHVTGTVTTTSYSIVELGVAGTQVTGSFTGGLVGVNAGTVTKSSARADVANTYTKADTGYSYGGSGYIGCLTGLNYGGNITESWGRGGLNKSWYQASSMNGNLAMVGALAGANAAGGTISNCWGYADPLCSYNYAGGLVGHNASSSGGISNCFGAISGWTIGSGQSATCGDAVGNNSGSLRNVYYAYSSTSGYGTNLGMGGLTNGQVLTGFDTSIWSFVDGQYPNLINNPR